MKRKVLDAFGVVTVVGVVAAVVNEGILRYEDWRWKRDEDRLTGNHRQ